MPRENEHKEHADTGQHGNPPAGGRNGAGDRNDEPTLDELLEEWDAADHDASDKDTGKRKPPKEPSSDGGSEAEKQRLERLEQRLAMQDYEKAMGQAVDAVKGDLQVEDDYVEFWLNKQADQDPRLMKLWEQRDTRRAEWNKALEALGRQFQEEYADRFGTVNDRETTGARRNLQDKVASAVHASRSRTPGDPNDGVVDELASMDDSTFSLKKAEILRQHTKR